MATIEKRQVRGRNTAVIGYDPDGTPKLQDHVFVDYVPVDILDAYVADAKTRWALVEVGDEHDAGPGGDRGLTHYPEHLSAGHEHAGQTVNYTGKVVG